MVNVEAYKCDTCNKLIEYGTEVFQLNLKSIHEKYDGVSDYDYREIDHHFCDRCARNIVSSLNRIAGINNG